MTGLPSRLLFAPLIVAAVTFPGCTQAPAQPVDEGANGPEESGMQSPDEPKQPRSPIPETVGATVAPFALDRRPKTIGLEVHAPTGPAALLRPDGQAKRVLLRIEGMKSELLAPSFGVYLNLPEGEAPERHPELHAFTLSTFGLVESSTSAGEHGRGGLDFLEDVTAVYQWLTTATDWDRKTLRLTFVPDASWSHPFEVRVSRVSLLLE